MIEKLIILKACREFSSLGIRKVSMDAIAASLHISKRTIYERYGDKQNLLACCLQHKIQKNSETIEALIKNSPDVVSSVVLINRATMEYALSFSPVFYLDIGCYHDIYVPYREQHNRTVDRFYTGCFEPGIRQHIFLPHFDIPQTLHFFRKQIGSLCFNPGLRQIESYAVTTLVYLSGICTGAGREMLRPFSSESFLIHHINNKQI